MKRFVMISYDGSKRYKLMYEWDASKPKCMFIMLNPSYLRPEGEYGPTSLKVIKYAKDKGYGGVWIGNLFPFITANPYDLERIEPRWLYDTKNDEALFQMGMDSKEIVFAWGDFAIAHSRGEYMRELFPDAIIIAKNRTGSPSHPLSLNFKY